MEANIKDKPWYDYLEEDLRELLEESFLLIDKFEGNNQSFHDYSFIVFPAAKAYEGYLKKLLLDLKFIREEDYYGKHFRIGKALNPQLEPFLRKEGVYDKLVEFLGSKEVPDMLWETWKNCRNLVFHWFPEEKRVVNYDGARDRVGQVVTAIDTSFKECRIK